MKIILNIVLCCALLLLFACNKINLNAAEKSLEGDWKVVNIFTAYGERTDLGIDFTENFTEEGDLGSFVFSDQEVDYRYTRLDTLYEGTSTWDLQRFKVRDGFVRVEQYTLNLEDRSFACEFGDQTSDAEREADMVRLIFETEEIGAYERFTLSLEKQ